MEANSLRTFARFSLAYLTLSFVRQKEATYELFALRGFQLGLGFDAPRCACNVDFNKDLTSFKASGDA